MLHVTSPGLIYLITASLFLFTAFIHFRPPAPPPTAGDHQSVLCIYEFDFLLLDSTFKWYYMVFAFLCLTSLSLMPSNSIHIVSNGRISFCLWLNNIPLCVCNHTFSVCSFVDGHSGYFSVLAIVIMLHWTREYRDLLDTVILFPALPVWYLSFQHLSIRTVFLHCTINHY